MRSRNFGRNCASRSLSVSERSRSAGYRQVLIDPYGGNRVYVHRLDAFRNFMSSVPFSDIRKEEEGRRISHVTAGSAAPVAMTFSTITAIWAGVAYGIDSFPFLVSIVIGYVFREPDQRVAAHSLR